MSRKPKDYKYLNIKLDASISKTLQKLSEDTRIPKTAIVERALLEYFKNYSKTGKL